MSGFGWNFHLRDARTRDKNSKLEEPFVIIRIWNHEDPGEASAGDQMKAEGMLRQLGIYAGKLRIKLVPDGFGGIVEDDRTSAGPGAQRDSNIQNLL